MSCAEVGQIHALVDRVVVRPLVAGADDHDGHAGQGPAIAWMNGTDPPLPSRRTGFPNAASNAGSVAEIAGWSASTRYPIPGSS